MCLFSVCELLEVDHHHTRSLSSLCRVRADPGTWGGGGGGGGLVARLHVPPVSKLSLVPASLCALTDERPLTRLRPGHPHSHTNTHTNTHMCSCGWAWVSPQKNPGHYQAPVHAENHQDGLSAGTVRQEPSDRTNKVRVSVPPQEEQTTTGLTVLIRCQRRSAPVPRHRVSSSHRAPLPLTGSKVWKVQQGRFLFYIKPTTSADIVNHKVERQQKAASHTWRGGLLFLF